MAVNATQEEQEQTADAVLLEKLSMERKLERELLTVYQAIADDIKASIAESGNPPNQDDYYLEILALLALHYRRVMKRVQNQFIKQVQSDQEVMQALGEIAKAAGTTPDSMIERIEAATQLKNSQDVKRFSEETAKQITTTNGKEFNALQLAATAALATQLGREPTKAEIGAATADAFEEKAKWRANLAALNETSKGIEAAKFNETEQFKIVVGDAQRDPAILPEQKIRVVRVWMTMLDNNVRPEHAQAHLQEDDEFGIFVVGGEYLRYPRDESLGASAWNTMKCRCTDVPKVLIGE